VIAAKVHLGDEAVGLKTRKRFANGSGGYREAHGEGVDVDSITRLDLITEKKACDAFVNIGTHHSGCLMVGLDDGRWHSYHLRAGKRPAPSSCAQNHIGYDS